MSSQCKKSIMKKRIPIIAVILLVSVCWNYVTAQLPAAYRPLPSNVKQRIAVMQQQRRPDARFQIRSTTPQRVPLSDMMAGFNRKRARPITVVAGGSLLRNNNSRAPHKMPAYMTTDTKTMLAELKSRNKNVGRNNFRNYRR